MPSSEDLQRRRRGVLVGHHQRGAAVGLQILGDGRGPGARPRVGHRGARRQGRATPRLGGQGESKGLDLDRGELQAVIIHRAGVGESRLSIA